ncbi:Deoxyribodipyrimidine photolyase [Roseibacterium elongatum DSM 19469]|uniref:Deoxyribodipyrimidine photolyase n=1 Tax=Roseicyclus elongatus DSM 19469 TaxID=1294273 RepID=W8S6U0_9RHOB|nr:FAD-binding domain-containing protein [Roseibacterium elongatum]AHM04626.1 Deoxyribodipyrimidine photolyase [Roseibacterium elongatum DSM 19469]
MTEQQTFPPTRAAALGRLKSFLPQAGRDYAAMRNHDLPDHGHPHVSRLSPYIRHRLLTEEEVAQAVLGRFSLASAEKFIREALWRTYWKGWLEMRPAVWSDYRSGLSAALDAMARDPALHQRVAEAEAGETGIAAFDGWMRELAGTGYLHNHARMWAASIWIFTLRLPWEIGADHFLRHLIDGDPASNTLGWRWVAGLQTRGKHYLARPSNIRKYTGDRPIDAGLERLVQEAAPLSGPPAPERRPAPRGSDPQPGRRTAVLLTEDDLSPGFVLERLKGVAEPVAHATLCSVEARSPRGAAAPVTAFTRGAIEDARARWADKLGSRGPADATADEITAWVAETGIEQLVTAYAPVGPAASALKQIDRAMADLGGTVVQVLRPWDAAAWPHATHGFFRFKEQIPGLVSHLMR